MSTMTTLAATEMVEPVAAGWQLILAFLAGIAVIVVLITIAKLHPFLALIFGALTVGVVAGEDLQKVLKSFADGFGSTAAGVGILIALGAMFAKLLADSGGADEIVDTIVGHASPRAMPWAMARVGLLNADLGITLALGVAVAIPTIIVAGPLFGKLAGKWVVVEAPHTFDADTFADEGGNGGRQGRTESGKGGTQVRTESGSTQVRTERRRPSFGITLFTVLLPVGLMLGKALVDIFIDDKTQWFRQIFDTVGTPLLALLIAVIVGMITLGRGAGMTRKHLTMAIESGLPPVAGIILIVAAGGGFKQVLVDSGIGTLLARWAEGAHFPVIVLAWILAVLIRLATGSATVATITASSLIIGLVEGMGTSQVSLVVLAVGAGSLFFSHVNDAGFWLVKEYFGMTVGQTIKTWSLMETLLSVSGLGVVMLLDLVI